MFSFQNWIFPRLGAGLKVLGLSAIMAIGASGPALPGIPSIDGTLTQPTLAVQPSRRTGAVLLYDSNRHRAVLFGGTNNQSLNETWVLDLDNPVTWELLPVTGSLPLGRGYCSAIYDPVADKMWIYGGKNHTGASYDEPAFLSFTDVPGEPAVWTRFSINADPASGNRPGPRYGMGTVYDPENHELVLYGGASGGLMFGGTWALSLNAAPAWRLLTGSTPYTFGGAYSNLLYDPAGHRFLMHGTVGYNMGNWEMLYYYSNDVWTLPVGGGTWTPLSATGSEPLTDVAILSEFHPLQNRIIVVRDYFVPLTYGFGFNQNIGVRTLGLDAHEWNPLSPVNGQVVEASDLVYDPQHDRMVIVSEVEPLPEMRTLFLTWTGISGVEEGRPPAFRVRPAHPNPFSSHVAIPITLDRDDRISISIFDAQGRLVRSLADRSLNAGAHDIGWDGVSEAGRDVAPGVYFGRIRSHGTGQATSVRIVRAFR